MKYKVLLVSEDGAETNITKKVERLLDIAEDASRCARAELSGCVMLCAGEERIKELTEAVTAFRSPYSLEGGKKVYTKKIV